MTGMANSPLFTLIVWPPGGLLFTLDWQGPAFVARDRAVEQGQRWMMGILSNISPPGGEISTR